MHPVGWCDQKLLLRDMSTPGLHKGTFMEPVCRHLLCCPWILPALKDRGSTVAHRGNYTLRSAVEAREPGTTGFLSRGLSRSLRHHAVPYSRWTLRSALTEPSETGSARGMEVRICHTSGKKQMRGKVEIQQKKTPKQNPKQTTDSLAPPLKAQG